MMKFSFGKLFGKTADKEVRFNPFYVWNRSKQLEGVPIEENVGVALTSSMRVGKLFGNVTRDIWPHDPNSNISTLSDHKLDKAAKPYRVHHYLRIRNEQEIKASLANSFPVVVSVPYFRQWSTTETGVIEFPANGEHPVGMHAFLICGYRDDHQYFNFANSWGREWGDNGLGWLPYGYFDTHGVEAYLPSLPRTFLLPKTFKKFQRGIVEHNWYVLTPARGGMFGIEFYDHDAQTDIAWAFAFLGEDSLDVEEFFVAPSYRGRGFARKLFTSVVDLSSMLGKPPIFWVPHIDNLLMGQDIHDLAWKFGLRASESKVNWAAKILLMHKSL